MKILIYGFKPYKIYKQNITKKIISRIRKNRNLKKTIFPVEFDKGLFLNEVKKSKPDIILGLGQCGKGKKIAIERKAVNLMRDEDKKPHVIFKNRPKYLFLNLVLKKDKNSRISYDAGQYVCNFSMYVIADYCRNKNIKYTFLHIPHDYNIKKAARFVESKLSSYLRITQDK